MFCCQYLSNCCSRASLSSSQTRSEASSQACQHLSPLSPFRHCSSSALQQNDCSRNCNKLWAIFIMTAAYRPLFRRHQLWSRNCWNENQYFHHLCFICEVCVLLKDFVRDRSPLQILAWFDLNGGSDGGTILSCIWWVRSPWARVLQSQVWSPVLCFTQLLSPLMHRGFYLCKNCKNDLER